MNPIHIPELDEIDDLIKVKANQIEKQRPLKRADDLLK